MDLHNFNTATQTVVRVNPQHLVGAGSNIEESAPITTVTRPKSHLLFSSKRIRFFGPIGIGGGAIPLREFRVGIGNRQGPGNRHPDALHNPVSTIFYSHYGCQPLTAKQFEVMWQFYQFVRGENVSCIGDTLRECIMTLWNRVKSPKTTFNKFTRKYIYEGWTDSHFHAFFEEYCALKAAAAVLDPQNKATTMAEWMNVRPPRALTTAEWQEFSVEIGYPWVIDSEEEYSYIDTNFTQLFNISREKQLKSSTKSSQSHELISSGMQAKPIMSRKPSCKTKHMTRASHKRVWYARSTLFINDRSDLLKVKKNRPGRLGKHKVVYPHESQGEMKVDGRQRNPMRHRIYHSNRFQSAKRRHFKHRPSRLSEYGGGPRNTYDTPDVYAPPSPVDTEFSETNSEDTLTLIV